MMLQEMYNIDVRTNMLVEWLESQKIKTWGPFTDTV